MQMGRPRRTHFKTSRHLFSRRVVVSRPVDRVVRDTVASIDRSFGINPTFEQHRCTIRGVDAELASRMRCGTAPNRLIATTMHRDGGRPANSPANRNNVFKGSGRLRL